MGNTKHICETEKTGVKQKETGGKLRKHRCEAENTGVKQIGNREKRVKQRTGVKLKTSVKQKTQV